MSAPGPVHPGRVAWTGDNSSLYLSPRRDAPYVTLASNFRVARSPQGPGQALVLIVAAHAGREPLSICMSDNEPLARWLVSDFARHFPQLREREEMAHLRFVALDAHEQSVARTRWQERFRGGGRDVLLYWAELGHSAAVTLPAAQSATGRHQMISVFIDVHRAGGSVDGVPLPGQVFPRQHLGRRSTTAFLALSETWIEVEGGA
jgi:hypothetical protein